MNSSLTFAIRRIEITTNPEPALGQGLLLPEPDTPLEATLISFSHRWRADIGLFRSQDYDALAVALQSGPIRCVIGDAAEVAAPGNSAPFVNATIVELDHRSSILRVFSSLTGLPPVFLFHYGSRTSLSVPFLPEAARGRLDLDPEGVADFLRWGHPIDGRTLFLNLSVLYSNSIAAISETGNRELTTHLPWPDLPLESLSRDEIVQGQVAAFLQSAARFKGQDAFVSLSGGLDSRASLVALLSNQIRPPCVTMAGAQTNLDARLARAYCDAEGLSHDTVILGRSFESRAQDLLLKTADLTGGVGCLSQTADLFLYESLPKTFGARISGNLGNQVGRGGVESLSAYQPRDDIFSFPIREKLAQRLLVPWFIPRLALGDYAEVLFGQEVHFWSIPNYVVGSSRALQLTPYADKRLLLLARAGFALDKELRLPNRELLRARDFRHRLAGTPIAVSFQRQFIAQYAARGRSVPLNWGWRAPGGWSAQWRITAFASAADAALTKVAARPGALRPLAKWASSRLGHRSSLVDWHGLVKGRLRQLLLDVFSTETVRKAGAFDVDALDAMTRRHLSGEQDCHLTLVRALELALGIHARAR